jgi:hypothetical protein
MMTAKEYLSQVAECERKVRFLTRQIDDLKSDMYSVRGVSYDKDRVQTSASDDQMLVLIAKADSLTREWQAEIDELMRIKSRIMFEISLIERPSYRWLLMYRYVDGMKWPQVAAVMGIENMRSLFFMHGRALKAFEKIYEKVPDVH